MKLPDRSYDVLKALFGRALELAPSEREEFLRRETEGEPELRRAVLRLLVEATVTSEGEFEAFRASPQIERYELGEVIGEGGGGIVIEAWQRQPRRKVAIKVLRERGAVSQQRFVQEIEILGQLSHPGIVQIIEGGVTADGRSFYVCELVPLARPITAYLEEERLELSQRLELFAQVCAAVAYAHGRGVLHLDLKPGNVLVDRDGRVRVIDFGIAQLATEVEAPAATAAAAPSGGASAGSLGSMAPEQAMRGGPALGPATDVYALGLLLFELVVGEPARRLAGLGLAEALRSVRAGDLPRLAEHASDLPPPVRRAIEAATRRDPASRCASPSSSCACSRRPRWTHRRASGPGRSRSRPPRRSAGRWRSTRRAWSEHARVATRGGAWSPSTTSRRSPQRGRRSRAAPLRPPSLPRQGPKRRLAGVRLGAAGALG